jgi:hypothetical protein
MRSWRVSRKRATALWVFMTLLANLFLLVSPVGSRSASADHTMPNGSGVQGDCWVAGTPLQCSAGYVSYPNYYYYEYSTYWSGNSTLTSQASSALTAAASDWTSNPGPQIVSSGTSSTPKMSVYVEIYPTYSPSDTLFQNALSGGAIAVTKNWTWNGSSYLPCYTGSANNCTVYFSEIYVNQNLWQYSCSSYWSTFNWQYIFAHELGHVQGLYEHNTSTVLMNNSWSSYPCDRTGVNGVTSTDLGSTVASGASACGSLRGIRCIFK